MSDTNNAIPDKNDKSKVERAMYDFNKVSIKKVPDVDTFQKLISVSPKLRAWYADWSFSNAAFSQMPLSFQKHGVTPEQWEKISAALPKINAIRKSASLEIEQKAADFNRAVEVVEQRVAEELAMIETPEIKILKVNITCLDFDKQMEILAKPETERKDFEAQCLEELRSKLLIDLQNKNFKDPFKYGDFKDLLA